MWRGDEVRPNFGATVLCDLELWPSLAPADAYDTPSHLFTRLETPEQDRFTRLSGSPRDLALLKNPGRRKCVAVSEQSK